MSQTIKVTAPYVTLLVDDPTRGRAILGFYEGAVVENVEIESAKHHLESGLAEKVTKTAVPGPLPEVPDTKSSKPDTSK